jgi:CheY-like chemotaxis protein
MGKLGTDVLIVEDDAVLRDELAGALGELGYGVASAADGQEALERLATEPRPRCVVIDLWMPKLGGSDVIEWLAANRALDGMRVVVMTGTPDSVLASCLERAGLALLPKPFTVEQLLATAGI